MWNWLTKAAGAAKSMGGKGGGAGLQFGLQGQNNFEPRRAPDVAPNPQGMMQPEMAGMSPQIANLIAYVRSQYGGPKGGMQAQAMPNQQESLRKGGFLTGNNSGLKDLIMAAINRARAQAMARAQQSQQPSAPPTSNVGPLAGGYQFPQGSQFPQQQTPPPVQTNPYGPFQ